MSDITTLRQHLFETLEALKDDKNPMDIERAKAVNETAQTIINSAKVEVDYMRISGASASSTFLPAAAQLAQPAGGATESATATGTKTVKPTPAGAITTHKLR